MLIQNRLAKAFPKGGLARAAAVLVSGTAAGQLIVVASTPILTRLYTPTDFGRFGLFLSFLSTASVAVSLRYEFAILSAADDDEANSLMLLVLGVSFPLALVLSVLLLALIRFNVLSYGVLPAGTWPIAAVALVAYGVGAGVRYWLLRAREFRVISEVSVLQGFARAILPLVILLGPVGWLGLVIGELGGRFAGLLRMLRRSSSAILAARTHGLSPIRRAATAYWKFPAVSVPSSLVEGLSVSLPLILIAHLFGEVSAGLFFLVQRVVSLPAAFVTTSIADVYHTKMAERFRTERSEMRALFVATSKSLATLACVVILPFAILLTLGFSRLFGTQWSQGGALVLVLAPWTIGGLIVSPVSRILLITQKLEHKLAYDLFTLVSTYAALYGAHHSNLSFVQGVTLLSAVRVVGYGGYFYVLLRAASLHRATDQSGGANEGRYA